MVAVKESRFYFDGRASLRSKAYRRKIRPERPFHLLQGSFSTRKVARQLPALVGVHKVTDGALIGVIFIAVMMSAFSLHWQSLWTTSYSKLGITRDLSTRLDESTAMLERQILESTKLPFLMVPTKAANLHYLERPETSKKSIFVSKLWSSRRYNYIPISHGY